MNFDSGTAYAESDADDEYERSVAASSPVLATDSETSPIDSELPSSNEHTPTTYGHRSSADRLPETIISEWTADDNNPTPTYGYETTISPPAPTPSSAQSNAGLMRQYSTKKIMLGTLPPKNPSPSPLQTQHERSIAEQTLDPSPAVERALLSSSHLSAMNGSGPNATSPIYHNSPNMPSPTSPPVMGGTTLGSRSYRSEAPTPSSRTTFSESDYGHKGREQPVSVPRRGPTPAPDTPSTSNASVEIFKSFRVSMDDPCYKVLPAALKKYQINAPWDQYALYIVYGDQERCLALDEKPLILFSSSIRRAKSPCSCCARRTTHKLTATNLGGQGLGTGSSRGGTPYDPPGGIIKRPGT
ncbi:Ste50p [Verticillium alfalfae VaMs.102]|uniref:Ste50p n=1 Tax=Verticillium alfalfae (strain VaMs.102 / ATCC MYA-4576 / FGSC 10136) TaxID=526221 RepID=C9SS50_VERA1|nr:Ste50p [Verticillium alfalfae VaMs.102]EEY21615.1 Ste50p [Verticillium alfalfae VaMs.102]